MKQRVIYHIDCNAFYASVEEAHHPELKRVPMAVCGDPKNRRGVILAKNERAKAYGVLTGESVWQARQKCPDLQLMPARHHIYRQYSDRINGIYETYTDQVERFGIDESYLDVTGSLHLFGNDPEALAYRIKEQVKEQIGITVSVGVSFNKIFAKIASDLKKPDAVTVIRQEDYKEILWPKPASLLLMVGKETQKKLEALGILTIGQLAAADRELLHRSLGKMGEALHDYANGLDDQPVRSIAQQEQASSIGNGMTFRRSLLTQKDITVAVNTLADKVAARLRRQGLKCRTIQVSIKDESFQTISRQMAIRPTYLAEELSQAARELILHHWRLGTPVRALTVTASHLIREDQAVEQISLFEGNPEGKIQQEKLEKTIDEIRERFGSGTIARGSVIYNDLGIQIDDEE